ncbi:2-oxoglutarate dehydrogenase E1 component [Fulvivirgaceae bacterium BMA10]|uniref:oxoglutarate dehydrogenase (succinyl-transferring) n=1 Tax=Splendidivirga corallicola TaxID=3051826 RepID=A0ABT8KM61_9BACT|nr:2-oxoglutarate dehydrogenase E1 component [Fulvivirgaceae bacterium BMA10]
MDKYSYISNAHSSYIDELYKAYKQDPESVDKSWQTFFEGFDFSLQKFGENGASAETAAISGKETSVRDLIHAYRSRGHLKSDTNPVRERRKHNVRLSIEDFGLNKDDLQKSFEIGNEIGLGRSSLQNILNKLEQVYIGKIGFEYMYIRDPQIVDWFKQQCEREYPSHDPTLEDKTRILSKLNEAVVFENFLHTKFLGQKRFSLEGGENTIPALDKIINHAAKFDAEEVVIGMAHRGRLNVLSNIMGKTYEEIFSEFEGNVTPDLTMGDGDVKYHLGYSSRIDTTSNKKVYVKLAPNPSHLEAVDPIVLGYARAQVDDEYKGDVKKVVPILIHGDAAIAGQGLVYEVVQMGQLEGYNTGGTIHIVINNQVGFTTDYDDARSSIYCTDVAKIVDAPVLHINGDDPEAVIFAVSLAVEYRQKFGKDIFIDLLCYRRHGHNESDEPKFTQPKLYNIIAKHPNPREIYMKVLSQRDGVDADLAKRMDKEFRSQLQDRLNDVKQNPLPYQPQKVEEEWHQLRKSTQDDFEISPDTSVSQKVIDQVATALTSLPQGFKPLKQIDKLLKERKANFYDKKTLSWADAELLAYGSLLLDNKIVRMSGQDVKRGTFSHRHSYLFDANSNEAYCNLNHISEKQEKLRIFNSLLSEYGVLGFEYGYAMATPHALVIWEAQFGDFVNGAQVILDQFISSAYTKWHRMNGLVLLLPHGYEGQGPEHSSARFERYLQMAAGYNMFICNPTTPANLFHALRRQLEMPFRMPLIIMSPKSLLRHPKVISSLEDFTNNRFQEVIGDTYATASKVKKVLLCCGKIYYDLVDHQQKNKRKDIAIVRLEQLHPFPRTKVLAELKKYKNAKVYWVQEEPENMGAWSFILRVFREVKKDIISRRATASPATGYHKVHIQEQTDIIKRAFE